MEPNEAHDLQDIRERVIRIETLLQAYRNEVPDLKSRTAALEKWQAKSIGIATAAAAISSVIISYIIKTSEN